MADIDPHLARWTQEVREASQETNTHEAYALGAGSGGPQPGWGGMTLRSSNTSAGVRTLEIDVRPVLLGRVECRVRLTTQQPGSQTAHSKKAYLVSTPAALRDLARQLLETADAADAMRFRPRPVP